MGVFFFFFLTLTLNIGNWNLYCGMRKKLDLLFGIKFVLGGNLVLSGGNSQISAYKAEMLLASKQTRLAQYYHKKKKKKNH